MVAVYGEVDVDEKGNDTPPVDTVNKTSLRQIETIVDSVDE